MKQFKWKILPGDDYALVDTRNGQIITKLIQNETHGTYAWATSEFLTWQNAKAYAEKTLTMADGRKLWEHFA